MDSWSGTANAYRTSFATLCAGTIPQLLEATGKPCARDQLRHLDVGCGTGELAVAAVSSGRVVTAVDADTDMVEATARTVRDNTADLVSILHASSPTLPFEAASFDVVTANFVVNHVHDPRATVQDLARVTASGGRTAMTIWTSSPGPHLTAYGEAAKDADAVPVPSSRLAPELDFPRSPDGLAELAEHAGLQVDRAEEVRWTWHTTAADLMAGIAAGIAGPGRIHRAQTEEVQQRIEQKARERWGRFAAPNQSLTPSAGDGSGGLAFPVVAAMVVASKPA